MEKYRFYILLGTIVALIAATPILSEISYWTTPTLSRFILTLMFLLMLLSAVLAASETRKVNKVAIAIAAPLILMELLQLAVQNNLLVVLSQLFGIVFLGFVIVVITGYLFKTDRASSNTICASICIYLLLGIFWSSIFSSLEIVHPDSFVSSKQDETAEIQFEDAEAVDSLYFSFVTLTTLGYGDITPATPTAKMLSMLEAISGQLFLAVLVARLMGLHISQAARKA